MVRVVKTDPHPSVVKETICRNCGVTLEYVPADIKREESRDYTGGLDVSYYIKCPPCNHKVYVGRN